MTAWGHHTRHILAGVALAAATLLTGCLAESEHPIAPADAAKSDARLWGAWLSEQEDSYLVAHVFATEAGTLQISVAEHGVEGRGDVETYDVHVTNLPSGDYLNILVTGSETGYLIGKYQFDGIDTLSAWFAGNEALEQAVKDKKLAGTVAIDGGLEDMRITAKSQEWQAFLAKAPAGLFGEPTSFKRIGPAYVEQQ